MSYRIQNKNGRPRIIWEEYRDGKRIQKHVPKRAWLSAGFNQSMSIDEARKRAKEINAHAQLKRWEAVRVKIREEQMQLDLAASAFAPEYMVQEFLNRTKRELFILDDADASAKLHTHWRAVLRMLMHFKQSPSELCARPENVIHYFIGAGISLSYAKKVLSLFNRWGFHVSREQKLSYVHIKIPIKAGQKIQVAYKARLVRENIKHKESIPLTPEMLAAAKAKLKPRHYNWLFVSLYFGLRPAEVDLFASEPAKWEVRFDGAVKCLRIWQPKHKNLELKYQYKLIPVLLPEQEQALAIAETGELRRPLTKTLERLIAPGLTCYGGRKHFEYMMIEQHGKAIDTVADWLGHRDLQMLMDKYRDRNRVRLR